MFSFLRSAKNGLGESVSGFLERKREQSKARKVRREINRIFTDVGSGKGFEDVDLYTLAQNYDVLSESQANFLREAVVRSGRFDLINFLSKNNSNQMEATIRAYFEREKIKPDSGDEEQGDGIRMAS